MDVRAAKYSELSGTEPKLYDDIEELITKGINKISVDDEVERINILQKELRHIN